MIGSIEVVEASAGVFTAHLHIKVIPKGESEGEGRKRDLKMEEDKRHKLLEEEKLAQERALFHQALLGEMSWYHAAQVHMHDIPMIEAHYLHDAFLHEFGGAVYVPLLEVPAPPPGTPSIYQVIGENAVSLYEPPALKAA